ncbi:MAG: DNA-formamidopyrimidine glycosylase family protein [Opitutaceae bacterium]
MPELAEVDYFRKRWDVGLNHDIQSVQIHERARVFRDCDTEALKADLIGSRLQSSMSAGKQMVFRTSKQAWLGVHLGMTGELCVQSSEQAPRKSDHLVLSLGSLRLVFSDPRMFGKIDFHQGPKAPEWWSRIPPALSSSAFTVEAVAAFLNRRARSPIKSVLLMQDRFPGIGNWMADEILWRAAIHPRSLAGQLTAAQVRCLHRECQWVARRALETIGETMEDPPANWLFPHRWREGGVCPRSRTALVRETIGGRTTCWSPGRQRLSVALR